LVGRELSLDTMPSMRFNTALKESRLRVKAPDDLYMVEVGKASGTLGDMLLSQADQQVLALALELRDIGFNPQIVTDDYSIQNVADLLGLEFTSLMTYGIRYRLYWIRYCPACRRKFQSTCQDKRCEICGTELKRRPVEKKRIGKQGKRKAGSIFR
jgi:UPF0271 protein